MINPLAPRRQPSPRSSRRSGRINGRTLGSRCSARATLGRYGLRRPTPVGGTSGLCRSAARKRARRVHRHGARRRDETSRDRQLMSYLPQASGCRPRSRRCSVSSSRGGPSKSPLNDLPRVDASVNVAERSNKPGQPVLEPDPRLPSEQRPRPRCVSEEECDVDVAGSFRPNHGARLTESSREASELSERGSVR